MIESNTISRISIPKVKPTPKKIIGSILLLGGGSYLTARVVEDKFYNTSAGFSKEKPIEIQDDLKGKIEPIQITTKDGVKLNCWNINPQKHEKYAMVFHGNCLNVGDYQDLYKKLSDKGIGVFAIEYRGYGNNGTNKITEKGLYNDAEAAIDYLVKNGTKKENIGVIGHSLGGAIATEMAARHKLAFMVLDSTFNNARDSVHSILEHKEVKANLPFFIRKPSQFISKFVPLKNKFKTEKKLKSIHPDCPILIVHCKGDDVIPFKLSQKNASNLPKNNYYEITTVTSDEHNMTPAKEDIISDFVERMS